MAIPRNRKSTSQRRPTNGGRPRFPGQVVLVLQGGGALGAYQVGVYEALHNAGVEPDWIIGTSIGAINAALIAGNAPENRLNRLAEFWSRMEQKGLWHAVPALGGISNTLSYWSTIMGGIPGFFEVNAPAFWGSNVSLGVDQAGYYSTTPTEVIFEDIPRRNSLIFAVHLWNPEGPEPNTILEVLNRQKDVQYSSRIASHIARQQQAHRLRHVISQLVRKMPDALRNDEAVQELAGYGCATQMHVIRLLAPQL